MDYDPTSGFPQTHRLADYYQLRKPRDVVILLCVGSDSCRYWVPNVGFPISHSTTLLPGLVHVVKAVRTAMIRRARGGA